MSLTFQVQVTPEEVVRKAMNYIVQLQQGLPRPKQSTRTHTVAEKMRGAS